MALEEFLTHSSAKAHSEVETQLTFEMMLYTLPRFWAESAQVSSPAVLCAVPTALVGAGGVDSTELNYNLFELPPSVFWKCLDFCGKDRMAFNVYSILMICNG